MKSLLTVNEVGQLLGFSARFVRQLVKDKRIPCSRIGGRIIVPANVIKKQYPLNKAAKLLGITYMQLYRLIQKKSIKPLIYHNELRITDESIQRYLKGTSKHGR